MNWKGENMIAICLRGPAGVGKTTIAYAVGRSIIKQKILDDKIAYISADMFAHISFDCKHTKDELDIKYELIRRSVNFLSEKNFSLIYDDTYDREQDYINMVKLLEKKGYKTFLFFLTAPLSIVLSRNKLRFWKERVKDLRLKKLYEKHMTLKYFHETRIDTLISIEDNCRLIIDIISRDLITAQGQEHS